MRSAVGFESWVPARQRRSRHSLAGPFQITHDSRALQHTFIDGNAGIPRPAMGPRSHNASAQCAAISDQSYAAQVAHTLATEKMKTQAAAGFQAEKTSTCRARCMCPCPTWLLMRSQNPAGIAPFLCTPKTWVAVSCMAHQRHTGITGYCLHTTSCPTSSGTPHSAPQVGSLGLRGYCMEVLTCKPRMLVGRLTHDIASTVTRS